ncbi:hypothetical protein, partial [Pseudomonas cannabina]|uniref:hypothetical protein n=2 Tax=Pseudomonas cannabina TaxID=86840 RepID=UPI001C824055
SRHLRRILRCQCHRDKKRFRLCSGYGQGMTLWCSIDVKPSVTQREHYCENQSDHYRALTTDAVTTPHP